MGETGGDERDPARRIVSESQLDTLAWYIVTWLDEEGLSQRMAEKDNDDLAVDLNMTMEKFFRDRGFRIKFSMNGEPE